MPRERPAAEAQGPRLPPSGNREGIRVPLTTISKGSSAKEDAAMSKVRAQLEESRHRHGSVEGDRRSIARHLAEAGAAVVVNYASSKDGADRVVDEIESGGGRAVAVQGDVAQAADVEWLFSEAKTTFGRLDIVVNSAGIYEFAPIEQVTAAHFHRQFDLNVLGLILAAREAVKHFGPGRQVGEHQLGRRHGRAGECLGVQRHQGRRRRHDALARQGARTAQDPGQCDQSGYGRDGGFKAAGIHESDFRKQAEAQRPSAGSASRRTLRGRGVPRVCRFGVDHR